MFLQQAFYKSVHQAEPNEREHICRYHSQDMIKTSDQKQNAAVTIDRDFVSIKSFRVMVYETVQVLSLIGIVT